MTPIRLAATAALTLMLGQAHANLVANGSFEEASPDFSANGSYCYVAGGTFGCSGTLTGWTGVLPVMRSDSGPWGNPSGLAGWSADFGNVQIGLQNEAYIEQTLNLAAGNYVLSWFDAGRGNWGNAASYEVQFGGETIGFDTAIGQGWTEHTLQFTLSGPQTLRFAGITKGADGTAFLDDISVTAAVPEPGSMALMLAGLGAVALTARRRRN